MIKKLSLFNSLGIPPLGGGKGEVFITCYPLQRGIRALSHLKFLNLGLYLSVSHFLTSPLPPPKGKIFVFYKLFYFFNLLKTSASEGGISGSKDSISYRKLGTFHFDKEIISFSTPLKSPSWRG